MRQSSATRALAFRLESELANARSQEAQLNPIPRTAGGAGLGCQTRPAQTPVCCASVSSPESGISPSAALEPRGTRAGHPSAGMAWKTRPNRIHRRRSLKEQESVLRVSHSPLDPITLRVDWPPRHQRAPRAGHPRPDRLSAKAAPLFCSPAGLHPRPSERSTSTPIHANWPTAGRSDADA